MERGSARGGLGRSRVPAHTTVVCGERGDRGRPPREKTKAKRPPPGARWPKAGLGPLGVRPRPLVPRPWAEPAPPRPGDRADTPGPGGPGGRERDGAGPRHARPKWATSGAAPRAGSPARARRRKRKRKSRRRAEATPNRHRPLARPGPASPRATRTPLGPGAGPGAIPGGGGRGRSRGPPTTRLGRRRPPYPEQSRAARNADSATGRQGARRSGEARPTQAAAPLAPRCPAGRGARVHARGGGAGASPAGPARMLPPHLPSSGFRSPGSAVDAGRPFGLSRGREVAVAFSSSVSFPLFVPWEGVPQILATSCLAPPHSRSGVPGRSSLPHPSSEGSPSKCSLSPLDSSLSFCSFRFCNLVSDARFPALDFATHPTADTISK